MRKNVRRIRRPTVSKAHFAQSVAVSAAHGGIHVVRPSIPLSTQPAGGRGLNIDELGSPVATHGGARTLNIVADAAAVAEVVMCAKHSSLSTASAANLLVRRARRISPSPSPPPMQCISIRAVTSNIFLTLPSVSFPLSFFLSQPHPECRCGNEDRLLGSK